MTIVELQTFSNSKPELRYMTEQIVDYLEANQPSGGAGVVIGAAVTGGVANRFLYVNAAGNLAQFPDGVGVLTSDGAGNFSWGAGGSAPIVPDTQIPFGNGVDPYTSSADFAYDVSGGNFYVNFSGGTSTGINLLNTTQELYIQNEGNSAFGDGLGISNKIFFGIGGGGGISVASVPMAQFIAGDAGIDGSASGIGNTTKLIVSDAGQLLTYQKGSEIYFSTDISNLIGYWGNPLGNTTAIRWDDNNKRVTVEGTGNNVWLDIDMDNDILNFFKPSTGAGIQMNVGANPEINLRAGQSQILIEDFGGKVTIGNSVGGNVTRLIQDDPNQIFTYQKGADIYFSTIVATGTEAGFWGAPSGVGNETSISWGDAAQTITLTATNGIIIPGDNFQITTPKTPASAGATGTVGQIAWDADFIYVCVATDTWERAAIATW